MRAALQKAIRESSASAHGMPIDFTPYRRLYVARQQAMEKAIEPLRARLRAALIARGPAMARLAAVDEVMERALGAREHALLVGVPQLLEKKYKSLQGEHQLDEAPGPDTLPEWQDTFGRDMQDVLLAELDIRMQPVEGLLEALRAR